MIDPADPVIVSLIQRVLQGMEQANSDRRGHFVADLTALSFLIDKGIATHKEVSERLLKVQMSLPAEYQSKDVSERTRFLIHVLDQVYGPKKSGWTPTVIQGGLDQPQRTDPTAPEIKD